MPLKPKATPQNAENLDGFMSPDQLRDHLNAYRGWPASYRRYGFAKARAMTARSSGQIPQALANEHNANLYYLEIPPAWRW